MEYQQKANSSPSSSAEIKGSSNPVDVSKSDEQSNSKLPEPPTTDHEHAHIQWRRASAMYRQRNSSGGGRRISNRRPSLMRVARSPVAGHASHNDPSSNNASGLHWWKFTLRPWDDDEEQDWWFASTAIPLLAATLGPLANVLSIAALVTEWRMCLVSDVPTREAAAVCAWNGDRAALGPELTGVSFKDPRWCYYLNIVSLVVGFIGNFFLLCNFTNRIRYIIALPVSILMWYLATGILIAITVAMHVYVPPMSPQQTYTQGFWYAVIAACLYMVCAILLGVNMIGYFLGHYPQHFNLTDSQRTLILQTMLFFVWLAGGGGVFSAVEQRYGTGGMNWSYVNSLYFCDVTILTVGFGDLYPTNNVARGLVFPYSVGGIIMLGLMVSSISRFAAELGTDNVVRKHVENSRARTFERSVTTEQEFENTRRLRPGERPIISSPMPTNPTRAHTIQFGEKDTNSREPAGKHPIAPIATLRRVATIVAKPAQSRKPKLLLLREEKDRFDAMRRIQMDTTKFTNWYALASSVIAFALLWCVGAVVFWICERHSQGLTYFQALYFCYVSLLTIGYGDLAPQSNPGRPFFVLWSLVAVPTMTILVSDLGETVIRKFRQGTFKLADFTVLPKQGVWREFLERHPWIMNWLELRKERRDAERRLQEGFPLGPAPEDRVRKFTIEELAKPEPSRQELARQLASKIRETANDMKTEPNKRYTYEEWVEFTRLIRFTARRPDATDESIAIEEEVEGLIEWDWIGEDSPMMSRGSEAEFVLDRLCESMQRFIRHAAAFMPTPKQQQQALNGNFEDVSLRTEPGLDPLPAFNKNFTFG